MLAKRPFSGTQDLSKVKKKIQTSPNRVDMMKDVKTMRHTAMQLEEKLANKRIKFTQYQRRLFDLNMVKKELKGYSTYIESLTQ